MKQSSTARLVCTISSLGIFFVLLQPVVSVPKNLSLPSPELCAKRKIHHKLDASGYYVSWLEKETRNLFLNWLDARNWCRDRCMDLISLETPEEIQLVKTQMRSSKLNETNFKFMTCSENFFLKVLIIKSDKIEYCWTSGRLCNFGGCDREDLKPIDINGWFWSASNTKLKPTNEQSRFNDWSQTGGYGIRKQKFLIILSLGAIFITGIIDISFLQASDPSTG
jgi:hypothetical protein